MNEPYSRLDTHPVAPATPVYHFLQGLPQRVKMNDPAIDVMTDLKRVKAVTTGPTVSIELAQQTMIGASVRLLLVIDADGHILGVITARDIMGEKPVSYSSEHRVGRDSILVEDIMTPVGALEALDLEEVFQVRVGDVVATLREAGRQHALVIEQDANSGKPVVRGLFSATQIGTQLGVEIAANGRVQSFAELEAMLVSG